MLQYGGHGYSVECDANSYAATDSHSHGDTYTQAYVHAKSHTPTHDYTDSHAHINPRSE